MVYFNISQFETLPFSTAQSRSQPVSDLCKQIDLAVFQGGTRKEKVTQKRGDDNFGTLSVALAPGAYKVVIVAHNQDKTPTMTNAEKITFSGDLADTFSWSKDITVNEGNGLDVDVSMRRVVAMVRFVTTDKVPDNISTLQLHGRQLNTRRIDRQRLRQFTPNRKDSHHRRHERQARDI